MNARGPAALPQGLLFLVLLGCNGGDDDGPGLLDPGEACSDTLLDGDGGDAILGLDGDDAEVPSVDAPTEALVLEALDICREKIGLFQAAVAPGCEAVGTHTTAITTAIGRFAGQLGDLPDLPGLDRTMAFGTSVDPAGPIAVFACSNDPSGRGQTMNAFALPDSVFMLEPLMNSLGEGAAYWDRLRGEAGSEEAIDEDQLIAGLAAIFYNQATGAPWQVVTREETQTRLSTSIFAQEIYLGGVAFVLFHEVAHVNLNHGVLNHVAAQGIVLVLEDAGYTPTDAEATAIALDLRRLSVATEAQADIYGATALRRAGHTTRGPAELFIGVVGMAALLCDESGAPDVEACVEESLAASHPPPAVRATIIRRVVRDGEDLTCLLDPDALTP